MTTKHKRKYKYFEVHNQSTALKNNIRRIQHLKKYYHIYHSNGNTWEVIIPCVTASDGAIEGYLINAFRKHTGKEYNSYYGPERIGASFIGNNNLSFSDVLKTVLELRSIYAKIGIRISDNTSYGPVNYMLKFDHMSIITAVLTHSK